MHLRNPLYVWAASAVRDGEDKHELTVRDHLDPKTLRLLDCADDEIPEADGTLALWADGEGNRYCDLDGFNVGFVAAHEDATGKGVDFEDEGYCIVVAVVPQSAVVQDKRTDEEVIEAFLAASPVSEVRSLLERDAELTSDIASAIRAWETRQS